jgi:hypothetical protein
MTFPQDPNSPTANVRHDSTPKHGDPLTKYITPEDSILYGDDAKRIQLDRQVEDSQAAFQNNRSFTGASVHHTDGVTTAKPREVSPFRLMDITMPFSSTTKRARVVRISMAYPKVHSRRNVALHIQAMMDLPEAPLDAGVTFGYGVGAWGCEDCVHIETATPDDISQWIVTLLEHFQQECAYVCLDGRFAYELSVQGKWTAITGIRS